MADRIESRKAAVNTRMPSETGSDPLELLWEFPPVRWSLEAEEIHVWAAVLDLPEPVTAALTLTLAPDEQLRARRFRFEQEQRRWAAGRGLLRQILGTYLECPPADIHFEYESQGKPALAGGKGPIAFNLSHSGKIALLAITRQKEVGVDVERVVRLSEMDAIAQRFFRADERLQLRGISGAEKQHQFFKIWTRKEAVLKCSGRGIGGIEESKGVPFAGFLDELTPAPGYIGSVAAMRCPTALRLWRWPIQ